MIFSDIWLFHLSDTIIDMILKCINYSIKTMDFKILLKIYNVLLLFFLL